MVSIPDAILVLFPNAVSLRDYIVANDGSGEFLKYWNPSLGAQPSQATLDVVTQAEVDAARLAKLRAAAKGFHLALDAENRALRATVKVLVDEVNLLRQWMTEMKARTAESTNYSTLKSGIGTLPNTPDRTYLQARNAIETQIDGES